MSKKALAFVTGLGSGYMGAQRQAEEKARQDRLDAQQAEMHAARMAEVQRQNTDRMALAEAAKPMTAQPGAGGMMKLDTADNRDVDGTAATVTTQPALDAYNTPEATNQRIAGAYRATGRPGEAISLENANWQQGRAKVTAGREDDAYAKRLKDEGVFEALTAFRTGDAAGMVAGFNKSGKFKIKGTPTITAVERDLPGYGKVGTFDAEVDLEGPDGKVERKRMNSHDLTMQFMPYEKQLDVGLKGQTQADRAAGAAASLDVARERLKQQGELNEARAALARSKVAPGGAPAQPAGAPVWNDKADALLSKIYFDKDENGAQRVDAQGAQFAKRIAMGVAGKNGGDSYSGLMHAVEVDQRLKAAATAQAVQADPKQQQAVYQKALAGLRSQYLQAVTSPPPAPKAALSPAGQAIAAAPPGSVSLVNGKWVPGAAAPVPSAPAPAPAQIALDDRANPLSVMRSRIGAQPEFQPVDIEAERQRRQAWLNGQ